jgi:hypothetical protein
MQEISSHIHSTTSNIASTISSNSHFKTSRREIMISQGHLPFPRFIPSRFFRCRGCRKWVRMAFRHLITALYRLHQSRFLMFSRKHIMSSQRPSPTRNITSATSSKSLFEMPRMKKMILQGLSAPWNIASSTSQNSFLIHPEDRLWVLRAIHLLKTALRDFVQDTFLHSQKVENEFAWPFDTLKLRFIAFTKVAL